jgi:hypothetical protein
VITRAAVVATLLLAGAAPAAAQRFPFERTFDVRAISTLDVATIRGKIDVSAGRPDRIVVRGTVTVRPGFNVPLNAVELARKVAANPPVVQEDGVVRLRPPSDEADLRAVTVAYQVEVPPDTVVTTDTDSGATSVRGVAGRVAIRTHSAAIDVDRVGADATIVTGSGAVKVDGVGGVLDVTTSSSAMSLRGLHGLRARTGSGAVDAVFAGAGDVDIETRSSAMRLRNMRGGLKVVTESGRVTAHGSPGGSWEVLTGSGSVGLDLSSGAFTVDASNRSGTIRIDGAPVRGTVSKRQIAGTIGAGGPLVRVNSRSGSIDIGVAPPP